MSSAVYPLSAHQTPADVPNPWPYRSWLNNNNAMDVRRRCIGATVEKENRENREEVTVIRLHFIHA